MGAEGGYRLVAGGAMPPLALDDDEAVAIAIGLRAAAAQAIEGLDEAAVRALAKVQQVLPHHLRTRVAALSGIDRASLAHPDAEPAVDPAILTRSAEAVDRCERLRLDYTAADGTAGERRVEPHGVVAVGHRWYLVAFDVDRDDWRTFRLDRVTNIRGLGDRDRSHRLPAASAADLVTHTMLDRAPTYEAVVVVHAPLAEARARMADAATAIEPIDAQRCRVRCTPDTAEWLAARLGALGHPFEVEEPPELTEHLRAFAAQLHHATTNAGPRRR
jgi:predicted DNA-binding transcriptional regulator YafY